MPRPARRLLVSLNLGATILLLGALFIMTNWISSRRYARWDLTRQQFSVLSGQTLQILRALEEPVTVVVFYQPIQRLYELIKDLLSEYQRHTDKVAVEFVDPEQDRARAVQLAQQFEIDDTSLVVFQSGTRHKQVTEPQLVEYDYQRASLAGPQIKAFKGEEAFTAAILSVAQTTQPLVWVSSGHGEKSLDGHEPTGLAEARRQLEQQNLKLETVTLLERQSIGPDVGLVVIPGPARRFTDAELQLLETYLKEGGRVLALVDPLTDTGLERLASAWGITIGNDIVVDPARQLPFVSAANLFVTAYTQHPIVEKMKTLATLYPLARSVRPAEQPPEGLKVTPLALTSGTGWGETQTGVETFEFTEGADAKGPVPIAAAAEREQPTPARLVVIGDSEFIVNAQLGNAGNKDLLLGAVNWLIERQQLIGISPKTFQSMRLSLTGRQPMILFFASLFGLPLLFSVLGAGMWWLRRT
jgi:ABC-type uncharacterized transport system involved in gliding motility auxiliary subunit